MKPAAALAIAAFAACAAAQDAPEVRVRATLRPPQAPYIRSAAYTLEVEKPADLEVTLPEFPAADGLGVRKREPVGEPLENGRQRIAQTWMIDAAAPGNYAIAPLEVAWKPGGRAGVPAMVFAAQALPPEQEQALAAATLRAIAEPANAEPGVAWPWLAAAAAAGALLAAAGYAAYRRMLRGAPAPPPAQPWETALRRLRQLAAQHAGQTARYEAFYVDLSAIVRYYIEDRFALHAPEMTTPEFLDAAGRGGALDAAHCALIEGLLRQSDRVKFARYEPSSREMDESFQIAERFVRETVPRASDDAPAPQEAAA